MKIKFDLQATKDFFDSKLCQYKHKSFVLPSNGNFIINLPIDNVVKGRNLRFTMIDYEFNAKVLQELPLQVSYI